MRLTTLGAALASLALSAGTTAVLAAGPAHAQTDTPTQVSTSLGGYGKLTAYYGTYLGTFSTQISDGTDPVTVGSARLQEMQPGKSWKSVKTDDDVSDGVSFGQYGSKAKGNVKYRVHYLGGTDDETATTYGDSFSNTVVVRTAWNMHENVTPYCQPRCRFFGKLSPKAKHHKVLIQVKHHGWKRYKVVHTNSRSHWSVVCKPTRGAGTTYRAVVAATKHQIRTISRSATFRLVPARSGSFVSPR
jgi:hypothetical protein